MQRYFIELAYNGTNFHGWQIQPNAKSVQEEINKCFSAFLREEINVVGAGRTDAGVHSSYFVLHFDTSVNIDTENFIYKMNRFLPTDIAIFSVRPVIGDGHARFSALSRTYHYYIQKRKNPFNNSFAYNLSTKLNIDKMNEAAKKILVFEDFTSFSKLHTDVKTNNCKVEYAKWYEKDDQLIFEIKADRFLRNMVRAIVGTLLEVGKGKLSVEDFVKIIEDKDRGKAGASAPAQGLFLTGIEYPDSIYKA